MPDQEEEARAAAAVTATTDSYGGPVSDKQLAEVYLPEGQEKVDSDPGRSSADRPTDTDPTEADHPSGKEQAGDATAGESPA